MTKRYITWQFFEHRRMNANILDVEYLTWNSLWWLNKDESGGLSANKSLVVESAHKSHTSLDPVSLWLTTWYLHWKNKIRWMTRCRKSAYK